MKYRGKSRSYPPVFKGAGPLGRPGRPAKSGCNRDQSVVRSMAEMLDRTADFMVLPRRHHLQPEARSVSFGTIRSPIPLHTSSCTTVHVAGCDSPLILILISGSGLRPVLCSRLNSRTRLVHGAAGLSAKARILAASSRMDACQCANFIRRIFTDGLSQSPELCEWRHGEK